MTGSDFAACCALAACVLGSAMWFYRVSLKRARISKHCRDRLVAAAPGCSSVSSSEDDRRALSVYVRAAYSSLRQQQRWFNRRLKRWHMRVEWCILCRWSDATAMISHVDHLFPGRAGGIERLIWILAFFPEGVSENLRMAYTRDLWDLGAAAGRQWLCGAEVLPLSATDAHQEWTLAVAVRCPRTEQEAEVTLRRILEAFAHLCPCCGSAAITAPGEHEICAVCNWQDDPTQRTDPNYTGGANQESLRKARIRWFEGASSRSNEPRTLSGD